MSLTALMAEACEWMSLVGLSRFDGQRLLRKHTQQTNVSRATARVQASSVSPPVMGLSCFSGDGFFGFGGCFVAWAWRAYEELYFNTSRWLFAGSAYSLMTLSHLHVSHDVLHSQFQRKSIVQWVI